MGVELDKVKVREALKPRDEPYWCRLDRGCSLGFRKMTPSSMGSWIARYRDAETGARPKEKLGQFGHLDPAQRYSAAKKAAEDWFLHLGRGGASASVTVKAACDNYIDHIRAEKGDGPADDLAARLERWVHGQPIASVPVARLTHKQVDAWRKHLAKTPVVVNPHAELDKQVTRPRSKSGLNREMTGLRAVLNHAKTNGEVTTDLAWKKALAPIEKATTSRNVYVTKAHRMALIGAAPEDFARFVKALCLVPLRPGAMAALTAGKLESMLGVLTVGKDKANRDRPILLPPATAAFFRELAADRPATAPLLVRDNGKPWDRHTWKGTLGDVVSKIRLRDAQLGEGDKVNLPHAIVVLTLRHSTITDLVVAGVDLFTVAKLSGTSIAMIEEHYGHLQQNAASKALENLAL